MYGIVQQSLRLLRPPGPDHLCGPHIQSLHNHSNAQWGMSRFFGNWTVLSTIARTVMRLWCRCINLCISSRLHSSLILASLLPQRGECNIWVVQYIKTSLIFSVLLFQLHSLISIFVHSFSLFLNDFLNPLIIVSNIFSFLLSIRCVNKILVLNHVSHYY
jgi:hypothetical protein